MTELPHKPQANYLSILSFLSIKKFSLTNWITESSLAQLKFNSFCLNTSRKEKRKFSFQTTATFCIIKDLFNSIPWDFLSGRLNHLICFNLSLYMPYYLDIWLIILITLQWTLTTPHHFWNTVSKTEHTLFQVRHNQSLAEWKHFFTANPGYCVYISLCHLHRSQILTLPQLAYYYGSHILCQRTSTWTVFSILGQLHKLSLPNKFILLNSIRPLLHGIITP